MKSISRSTKHLLTLAALLGAAQLQAEEYTRLEPIGTKENPQYLTATPAAPRSNLDFSMADWAEKSPLLGPGQIGRSYVLASYDYVHDNQNLGVIGEVSQFSPMPGWGKDLVGGNTHGATIRGNFPVTVWMDLGLQYSYQTADWNSAMVTGGSTAFETAGDTDVHNFLLDLTFHYPVLVNDEWTIKPYGRTTIGMVHEKFDVTAADYTIGTPPPVSYASSGDSTEGLYAVEAGVELPLGNHFALTPFVGWRDYFDSDYGKGTCVYGGRVNVYLGYGFGIVATAARTNQSETHASIGATFSF